jgi:siroheme synthase-like protein
MTARYPVLLDLAGQPCLVVGGGVVAARKVRGLLDVAASVTVIAPTATGELAEAASAGRLRWHERAFADADIGHGRWRFVVAATDRREVNRRVVDRATEAGTWANDASVADGGPAALPAVHRDGPVTLTVSTGGIHPGAAAWLRELAAGAIGPEHLTALELAAEIRAATPGGLRPDWRAAVDSGMLDLIREGRVAEAKERLQACLSLSSD